MEDREIGRTAPDPADALLRRERMEAVREAVDALPPELKGPFVLAGIEGLSHEETALRLSLSPKAVESKVYRARKLLSKRLSKAGIR